MLMDLVYNRSLRISHVPKGIHSTFETLPISGDIYSGVAHLKDKNSAKIQQIRMHYQPSDEHFWPKKLENFSLLCCLCLAFLKQI